MSTSRSSPAPRRQPPRPVPISDPADTLGGTILRLRLDKGFGFLVADPPPGVEPGNASSSTEYFFHVSVVTGGKDAFAQLRAGDTVEFRAVSSERGPRAIVVTKL